MKTDYENKMWKLKNKEEFYDATFVWEGQRYKNDRVKFKKLRSKQGKQDMPCPKGRRNCGGEE